MTCRTAIHRSVPHAAGASVIARSTRRRRQRGLGWLVGSVTLLGVGLIGLGVARAAPGDDPAQRVVDAALQDTLQVFGSQATLSREDVTVRLRGLLDHYVDLPRVGRDSLGAHWRRATPDQQAAFLAVFERFLCVGYAGSAVRMGGLRFGPTAVVDRDDGVTVVRTDAQLSDGSAQPVLFMVGRSDDGSYRITDVVAAAISMSRLFSADFVAVLRNNGGQFDALIDALTSKLAAANANP